MIPKLIRSSFLKMSEYFGETFIENSAPLQQYHDNSPIPEANSVFYFAKACCDNYKDTKCFFEFSCDSGRIDCVLEVNEILILIEAKSTLFYHDYIKKLSELEKQVMRLEDNTNSLRKYLFSRIVNRRAIIHGSGHAFKLLWGVILADTFEEKIRDIWMQNLPDFPSVAAYDRRFVPNINFNYNNKHLYHMFGFKELESSIDISNATGILS